MRMRCGLHDPQTTLPHFRQWCFLTQMLNCVRQMGQSVTSASGCHRGRMISEGSLAPLMLGLAGPVAPAEVGCGRGLASARLAIFSLLLSMLSKGTTPE